MMPLLVQADSMPPQPWRNGGGQTRELLVWPTTGDWRLRISRADITSDGPFSAFPQVTRWFAVLHGTGVALTFAGRELVLRPGDAPLCFDGAAAPGCRLLGGATQDLNLMTRNGSGTMRQAVAGQSWNEPFAKRGLYTLVAGNWRDSRRAWAIAAHTLLWVGDGRGGGGDAWTFEPSEPGAPCAAWWLGFTPEG